MTMEVLIPAPEPTFTSNFQIQDPNKAPFKPLLCGLMCTTWTATNSTSVYLNFNKTQVKKYIYIYINLLIHTSRCFIYLHMLICFQPSMDLFRFTLTSVSFIRAWMSTLQVPGLFATLTTSLSLFGFLYFLFQPNGSRQMKPFGDWLCPRSLPTGLFLLDAVAPWLVVEGSPAFLLVKCFETMWRWFSALYIKVDWLIDNFWLKDWDAKMSPALTLLHSLLPLNYDLHLWPRWGFLVAFSCVWVCSGERDCLAVPHDALFAPLWHGPAELAERSSAASSLPSVQTRSGSGPPGAPGPLPGLSAGLDHQPTWGLSPGHDHGWGNSLARSFYGGF